LDPRERKLKLRGIFWTQERRSKRKMVLRGLFGTKRGEVRVGWC